MPFTVHSYHLNVGAGDSGIHLLVNGKTIERAVLVDGGPSIGFPVLQEAIERLQTNYIVTTQFNRRPQLKFDAIVVSHWDDDHYNGLCRLLQTDLQEQWGDSFDPDPKAGTPSANQLQSRYMKYDRLGPRTYFYVPYWERTGPFNESNDIHQTVSHIPQWNRSTKSSGNQFLDILVGKWDKKDEWCRSVALLCTTTGLDATSASVGMIGRNFFYNGEGGKFRVKDRITEILRPSDLIDTAVSMGHPGLYCIGADSVLVQQGLIINKTPPVTSDLPGVIDGGRETSVNKSSIILVILTDSGTPLHYFGGDVAYHSESWLPQWFLGGGPIPPIRALKLGHHGASCSSPVSLLRTLNPDLLIASCGHLHSHPRFEILLYLAGLLEQSGGKLLSTCYAHWFTTPPTFGVRAITEGGSNSIYARWQTAVTQAATNAGLDGYDFTKQPWKDLVSNPDKLRAEIVDVCKDWWRTHSATTPQMCPMQVSGHIQNRSSSMSRFTAKGHDLIAWRLRFESDRTFYKAVTFDSAFETDLNYVPTEIKPKSVQLPPSFFRDPRNVRDTRSTTRAAFSAASSAVSSPSSLPSPRKHISERNVGMAGFLFDQLDTPSKPAPGSSRASTPSPRPVQSLEKTTSANTFYFVSSLWENDIPLDLQATDPVSLRGSSMDNVAKCIGNAVFALSSPPSAGSRSVPLEIYDQMCFWMKVFQNVPSKNFVLSALTSLTPSGTESKDVTASLDGFTMVIDVQVSSESTIPLGFSTEQASTKKQLAPFSANADGTVPGTALLIFAIKDTSKLPALLSIYDIATLVQFPVKDFPLYGLGNAAFLRLDNPDCRNSDVGPRNCIWFSSADAYETHMRLQFVTSTDAISGWLQQNFFKVITMKCKPVVIARKRARSRCGMSDFFAPPEKVFQYEIGQFHFPELMLNMTCALHALDDRIDVEIFFCFKPTCAELILLNDSASDVETVLGTLANVIKIPLVDGGSLTLPNIKEFLPDFMNNILSHIILSELRLTITDNGGIPQVVSVAANFELHFNIGGTETKFLIMFSGPQNVSFLASLWIPPPAISSPVSPPVDLTLLPNYERYKYVGFKVPTLQQNTLHLANLVPGRPQTISNPPSGIGLEVKQLSFQISKGLMQFQGSLGYDGQRDQKGDVPHILIDTADLMATFTTDGSNEELSLSLHIALELNIPAQNPPETVKLIGQFDYDEKKTNGAEESQWSFSGTVQNLRLGWLGDFMDTSAKDILMGLLSDVYVQYLFISYEYHPDSTTKSFVMDGMIEIDVLLLRLSYSYTEPGWEFRAVVGSSGTSTTLKKVIGKFCSTEVLDWIPNAFDIPLNPLQSQRAQENAVSTRAMIPKAPAPQGHPCDLDEFLVKSVQPEDMSRAYVLLVFTLSLENGRNLTLIQIHYKKLPNKPGDVPPPPKTLVRFTLATIPDLGSGVPTVDSLPQPFDAVEFVFVHDTSGQGMIRSDLAAINTEDVLPSSLWIPFKDNIKPPGASNNILITPGCHLVASLGAEVRLDYTFGGPTAPSSKALTRQSSDPPSSAQSASTTPTMAPCGKSFGPLSIANFGFSFADQTLSLHLDATLQIGPITFGILGLRFDFHISQKATIDDIIHIVPDPHIDGLKAEFNQPPIVVAGLFERTDGIWRGGLDVSMEPYTFMAVGSYGYMYQDDQGRTWADGTPAPEPSSKTVPSRFKSVFFYGVLDGPIADLGFMEVVGVKLGFGYNTFLRNPDLTNMSTFPMIKNQATALAPGSLDSQDPLALLVSFCQGDAQIPPWVTPKNGILWFSVGMTIVAFDLLTVTAIVLVQVQPSVVLDIFADAIAVMPGNGADAADSFVYVEFQIVASIDFERGSMIVDGKLTPNSFILDPACHLSGQFGMRYWFGNSPYAGDWVYTVGGYHPAYKAPPQYPACDRLKISWSIDSNLSVTGSAYFAITPKAAMGGGALHAVFSLGLLNAHFDAYADFLITFNKFYFQGDVGVSVGVGFTIDLLFCSVHISCDIGATLHIEGPRFGGVVHVDFWLFGFDIAFGASPQGSKALSWEEFWDLLVQDASSSALTKRTLNLSDAAAAGQSSKFIFSVLDGSIPSKAVMDTPSPEAVPLQPGPAKAATPMPDWYVRAGLFRFRIETKVPFTDYAVTFLENTASASTGAARTFSVKPMQVTEFVESSILTVTIAPIEAEDPRKSSLFRPSPISKAAPASIWAPYNPCGDPAKPNYDPTDLLDSSKATMSLPMALDILVPLPNFTGGIPAFNAMIAMPANVCKLGGVPDPHVPSAGMVDQHSGLPDYRCSTDGSDLGEAWDRTRHNWTKHLDVDDPPAKAAVESWGYFFGWKNEHLKWEPPIRMIGNLEQEFLGAPFGSGTVVV